MTQSGKSLLPTFARGIEQNSDEPAQAVSRSLSTIRLEPPSFPPITYEPPPGGYPEKPEHSSSSSAPSIVFQKGAISVTVSGATALDDLEQRLTEIFARASLRLGVSNA